MLNRNTIYERVILLLVIAGIIFLLLFSYMFLYTIRQEKQVYNAAKQQFNNEVVSLLDLNSESMRLSVNDFTSSDDLVSFTQSRSTKWYNEHIVGAIKSFKVDYICVYDTSFNIISETSSLKILSRRFIPREAVIALEKSGYLNFFLQTTEGLVEVSGASIHPTSDRLHNKTKSSGYTFMVRLWDDSFKTKLSKITSSKVEFRQLTDQEKESGINSVRTSINLSDWNNKTVSQIIFSRGFNLNFKTSKLLLYTTVIAFIIGIVVFVLFARLWIYRPLNLITQILESENNEAILKLKKSPGEYHYIGTLFEDYFNQQKILEQAKLKAEESDKLKSAFLSNIAHEIRTPMHGILGFADLLKTTSLSGEQMQEYISIIEKSSIRMLNTITDLIEISKIESGQIEITQSMVDVKLKLEKMYAIFRPEADKKGIQLSIKNIMESDQPIVRTDREKLETIFSKLLKNALKYTNKGSIEVGYEYDDKFLKFFVKDTGIGIEKEKYQSVFDRFTQADNSLSKNYEGFGLGLAISKAYVEMLGGKIWVESEPGKGSVFYFTLPYKSQALFLE
jgi:signal transduction histidine kinase